VIKRVDKKLGEIYENRNFKHLRMLDKFEVMKFLFPFLFILGQRSGYGRGKSNWNKDSLCHTWHFLKYEDGGNVAITDAPIMSKVIRFTPDSVFITVGHKFYAGIWNYKLPKLNIIIDGHPEFNYSLST
jgi:hypothetical protein